MRIHFVCGRMDTGRGSGGRGEFRGGDGLVREIELLAPAQVTFLCDRRKFSPYGLAGGDEWSDRKDAAYPSEWETQRNCRERAPCMSARMT